MKQVIILQNGAIIKDPETRIELMRDGGYCCGEWESDNYHRKAGIKRNMPLPKWCREGMDSTHYVYATDVEIHTNTDGREYPIVRGRIVPVITKTITEKHRRYAGGCTSLIEREETYRVVTCAGVELERYKMGERDLRTLWSIPENFQRDYLRKTNSTLLNETREMEKAHEDYSIVSIDGVEMLRAEWENVEKTTRAYRRPIIACMGNVYRADYIIDNMYRIEGWKDENDVEEKSVNWSRVEERIAEKIFRKESPIYRLHERAGESEDGYRMEYDEWAYYYEYYDVITESGAHYYATKRIDVK